MARTTLTRSRSAVIVLLRLLGAAFAAHLEPFCLTSGLVFLAVLLRERRIGLRQVLLVDVLVGLAWIVSSIRHYFTCRIESVARSLRCKIEPGTATAGHCISSASESET